MSALPMGWEKRQQEQEVSSADRIGDFWDRLGPTYGSVGASVGAVAQGASDWFGGGGGSSQSLWDLFGGTYDQPELDYVPLGQGSAEAARKAEGLPEGEVVYTMV